MNNLIDEPNLKILKEAILERYNRNERVEVFITPDKTGAVIVNLCGVKGGIFLINTVMSGWPFLREGLPKTFQNGIKTLHNCYFPKISLCNGSITSTWDFKGQKWIKTF